MQRLLQMRRTSQKDCILLTMKHLFQHRLLLCMQRSLPRAWHFWTTAWYKCVQYVLEKSSALWKERKAFWRQWNVCRYFDSLTCGPCIGENSGIDSRHAVALAANWIQKGPKDLHCDFRRHLCGNFTGLVHPPLKIWSRLCRCCGPAILHTFHTLLVTCERHKYVLGLLIMEDL